MNSLLISFRYLKANLLTTFVNILLIALGVGMLVLLWISVEQSEANFSRNLRGIDMVIGSKGSPQQIILSSIYHADYPTGNIKLVDANKIAHNPLIKKAIPLGLGDSYQGFRIVGTTLDYPNHYEAKIEKGQWWKEKMEVVIGKTVAQELNLSLQQTFSGSHGLSEGGDSHETLYKVVGIMQETNTVLDKLILTDLSNIWQIHTEHEEETENHEKLDSLTEANREITALLLTFNSPLANVMLPRQVNQISNLQAAVPAMEMARLYKLIGTGTDVLQTFAYILLVMGLLNTFVVFYNMMQTRQYDLAMMRTLGATAWQTVSLLLLEVSLLAFLGIFLGISMAHGGLWLLNTLQDKLLTIDALQFYVEELFIALVVWITALLAALVPAIQAYRLEVIKVMKNNS